MVASLLVVGGNTLRGRVLKPSIGSRLLTRRDPAEQKPDDTRPSSPSTCHSERDLFGKESRAERGSSCGSHPLHAQPSGPHPYRYGRVERSHPRFYAPFRGPVQNVLVLHRSSL